MAVKSGRGFKKKAWDIARELVYMRTFCENCGKEPKGRNRQACHILSRTYAHTYTDPNNLFLFCGACHNYFTKNPVRFGAFTLLEIGSEIFKHLEEQADRRDKMDWETEYYMLKELKEEFGDERRKRKMAS